MRAAALVFFCVRPAAAGWTLTCSDGATTYEQGRDLLGDLKAMMDSTSDEAGVDCCITSTHPPLATTAPLLEERPPPLSLSKDTGGPAPVQAKGAQPEPAPARPARSAKPDKPTDDLSWPPIVHGRGLQYSYDSVSYSFSDEDCALTCTAEPTSCAEFAGMANYPGCASDCPIEDLCLYMTYMPDAADGVCGEFESLDSC